MHRRDVQALDVGDHVERDRVVMNSGQPGFDIAEYRLSGGITSAGNCHGGSNRERHDAGDDALPEPAGSQDAANG